MNTIDRCVALLKELSNARNDFLPAYNQEAVDECSKATEKLFQENQRDTLDEDLPQEDKLIVVKVRHSMILFIKRALVAYHHERLVRLKKLKWQFGSELPAEITCNLSVKEVEWFALYCQNLETYMGKLNEGKGFDLTLHKTAPKRVYIQVRCLVDHGEHVLEDGTTVCLQKDSLHYLPFSQCEKLIHQGIIEQILD